MSVKISELPVLAPEDVAAGDVVAIVDSSEGVTKQVDLAGVLAEVAIDAPSQLTQSQATDPDDETFGTVSGKILDDQTRSALNAGGDAPLYACRAWVNFDGTTTPPTVRGSGNVSSVVRNGTGDYTVNFATAMPDANYSLACVTTGSTLGNLSRNVSIKGSDTGGANNKTTSAVTLQSGSTATAALVNMAEINVAIFR